MIRTPLLLLAMATPMAAPALASPLDHGLVKCTMTFTLKGWSAIYKTASGLGTLTCDDGRTMPVKLSVEGGGLTFGKLDILEGKGEFSTLKSADEALGKFVAAEATAGAVKASQAAVYTKGEVSLALTGTGRGFGIGIDFGKLEIERLRK